MSWRAVCECGWRGAGHRTRPDAGREAWEHEIQHWAEDTAARAGPLPAEQVWKIRVLLGLDRRH